METPKDLTPIPTQPWNERPDELPLDIEECRTALWMSNGNVSEAAKILKVPSSRLRRLIRNSAYLQSEQMEARERLADMAEEVVKEALEDDQDKGRRDSMARFVLNSTIGKQRGYGNGAGGVQMNLPNKGRVVISWDNGEQIAGDSPKTIEGEVVDG